MGSVTALMAGDKLSAQEVLVDLLEDVPAAVMVLTLDEDGRPGVTCSGMKVAELALLERACSAFVTTVVSNWIHDEEGGE